MQNKKTGEQITVNVKNMSLMSIGTGIKNQRPQSDQAKNPIKYATRRLIKKRKI
mgnify:CR=1 FL=1